MSMKVPTIPLDSDGFVITFAPEDGGSIAEFLDIWGFVAVHGCLSTYSLLHELALPLIATSRCLILVQMCLPLSKTPPSRCR